MTNMSLSTTKFTLLILLATLCLNINAQETKLPYQDECLSIDERVNDLISRMTLKEKIAQMSNRAPAIPRLDVPRYDWWNECLHGVGRAGEATVFPQAIGLAATWDTQLIYESAVAISDEARAKHHEALRNGELNRYEGLTFWTPNVNIFRDPRWGRGQETYGEDPYLTARLGVNFVKGLQGDDPEYLKLVATPKHFAVHSGPESSRHFFDAAINERDLYDTYLPAFEACIKEGKAYSVMGAYNRTNGVPCCASPYLLTEILRDDWGFEGYVVSDCNSIRDVHDYHNFTDSKEEAAAASVLAGCDLECGIRYAYLEGAVEQGFITEDELDVSLKRLFVARFKLGMFDSPENVPYSNIPMSVVSSNEHRALALETAQKSIVLLKNENETLPLKKDIKSIAVIGPNANNLDVMLGNYNGFPLKYSTPLEGIKSRVSKNTEVYFETGCELIDTAAPASLIPADFLSFEGKQGLQASYFNNTDFSGKAIESRVEKGVNSNWNINPVKGLNLSEFSVKYTGKIKVNVSGEYQLGLQANGAFQFALDGTVRIDNFAKPKSNLLLETIYLEKGKEYDIEIAYKHKGVPSKLKMMWKTPEKSSYDKALELAQKSEVIVFVGGISPRVEGEQMKVNWEGFDGGDRTNLQLPAIQTKLLKDLHATGKPVVFVMLNGSALAINWEDENLPAILEAWYPGEQGGAAIADVLFGNYNPSGRLPLTFYKSKNDLPQFVTYAMKGRTYRYFEGKPLYAFGYGLSYTNFDYKNITLSKTKMAASDSLEVSIEISNSGKFIGDEVVQLYITDVESDEVRPLKSLRGIKRISLEPGKSTPVTFTVKPEDLAFFDIEQDKKVVEPGVFEIGIGPSSDQLTKQSFEVVATK